AIYPPPRGKDTQNAYGKCVSDCQACEHSGGAPINGGCACTNCTPGVQFTNCNPNEGDPNLGGCFCFDRADGGGTVCGANAFCSGVTACPNGNSDCPAGSFC